MEATAPVLTCREDRSIEPTSQPKLSPLPLCSLIKTKARPEGVDLSGLK